MHHECLRVSKLNSDLLSPWALQSRLFSVICKDRVTPRGFGSSESIWECSRGNRGQAAARLAGFQLCNVCVRGEQRTVRDNQPWPELGAAALLRQQQGRGEIRGKNRRNRASPGAEAPAEMGPKPLKGVGGEGRTPEGQEESPVGAVACTEITFL